MKFKFKFWVFWKCKVDIVIEEFIVEIVENEEVGEVNISIFVLRKWVCRWVVFFLGEEGYEVY